VWLCCLNSLACGHLRVFAHFELPIALPMSIQQCNVLWFLVSLHTCTDFHFLCKLSHSTVLHVLLPWLPLPPLPHLLPLA
jgi:hypothetical protein